MSSLVRRIGLIVPSSNVTMETELPELFRRREAIAPERFTFHSARMRMSSVTPKGLALMNAESGRCAVECPTLIVMSWPTPASLP